MTSRDLATEIATVLADGEATAREVAAAVHVRAVDVLDTVRTDARFSGPFTRADRRLVYRMAPAGRGTRSRPNGKRTQNQRVLDLLSDGEWHDTRELYRLGTVAHSRVSELRKIGHAIEYRRDGDTHLYRLVA